VLKSLKLRAVLVIVPLLIFIIFLLPNVMEIPGDVKKWLPSEKLRLGLDLKGGMHLLLALDTDKLMENMIDRKVGSLKDGMIREGIRFLALDKKGEVISVVIKADQREKFQNMLAKNIPDLRITPVKTEGDDLFLDLSMVDKNIGSITENAVNQAVETIRNRIDQYGVVEPVIVKQGSNEILVQLPGVKDPQRARELIGKTAQLEFKLVDDENASKTTSGVVPEGDEVLTQREWNRDTGVVTTAPIMLKKQALLTGDMLSDAKVQIGGQFKNEPEIQLEFNSEGARVFEQVTGENVNKRLAIVLDNMVYSAPNIREKISGGRAVITGSFGIDEAKEIAIALRAGALPAPVKELQNITIGPSLGQDSINKGLQASILGALLIIVFMIFYYKASGVVADIVLFLNLIYLLGIVAIFGFTMTLPGIAGIILTIGIGVDTNVLIFERIREELRLGKTVRAAVDAGYSKAWVTIFDAHITTLITTFVLFIFGTGPIKGFAVNLSIGIIVNLFTAVFGSKAIFDWIIAKYQPRSLSI
jgi:preprotein translocase subunit SecD